jgi:hypothetical protein
VSHSGSSHLSWLDNRITFCEQHKLWSSSLCNFLLPPVTFTTLTFKNVRFHQTVHYDSGNSRQLFFPNSIKNLFFVMVTRCVFWNAVNAIFKYYLYEHRVSKDWEVSKCSSAFEMKKIKTLGLQV